MSHRFRFLGRHLGPQQWELLPDEWHHLLKVLRLPVGSELEIADGAGHVAQACLTHSGKNEGVFEVLQEDFFAAPAAAAQITLAIGALKPQSADDLLPYLIELGMDGIEVFASQSVDKNRMQDKVRERWDRIATAAMKQCKRPWVPVISWSDGLEVLIHKAAAFPNRIFLDPEGEQNLARWQPLQAGPTLAVIGSEKGLDADEVLALREQGFVGCRIEGSILRATTAAIASAALLRQIIPYKS
ncbi:MAG TPA: RsmE family RNA methyltransferase [Oligoflexus sp.]|uniref:RsmE family RNA methyltransferase n=1 Tax=Oligoflexus sp. TaxID=1971216 RepID=UPI002D72FDBC|nr:RsmE family RNA methyltransferase [Oligoflexus sp.]HYX38924.1 RsmE family RNA methyltransferase [Oligoflexus sp.]